MGCLRLKLFPGISPRDRLLELRCPQRPSQCDRNRPPNRKSSARTPRKTLSTRIDLAVAPCESSAADMLRWYDYWRGPRPHWQSITADDIVLQVPDEARLPADPDTIGHYCRKLRLSSIRVTQWHLTAERTQVLFATGDVMCQQAVERKGLDKQDLKRTGRMALYGGGTLFTSATMFFVLLVLIAPLRQSCFWPRCNSLVQVPATTNHPQIRECYHRRPSPG